MKILHIFKYFTDKNECKLVFCLERSEVELKLWSLGESEWGIGITVTYT